MFRERAPCCLDPRRGCATRFAALKAWVCRNTGKGVRLVELVGEQQGGRPFFAQPVGYDGRTFYIAADQGCDTEKLLHEACHYFVAPRERRQLVNYGHGPGPFKKIDDLVSDNEEVTVSLLEEQLAPYFRLRPELMNKPDYNVANRKNLDWDECAARAATLFATLEPTLSALA